MNDSSALAGPPGGSPGESRGLTQAEETEASSETKRRLLDAAERLFAQGSYESTSLRQITAEAGANLAAVHYHFGSKEGLFQAVFARRVGPINDERLRRLAELEARPGNPPPTLDELFAALLDPALVLRHEPGGAWFLRLMGRSFCEPGEHWNRVDREFDSLRDAYLPAFRRCLPQLGDEALRWRLFFAVGSMCVLLTGADQAARTTGGPLDPGDEARMRSEILTFLSHGVGAPAQTEGGAG